MDDTNTPIVFHKFHYHSKGIKYQIWGGMIHAYKTKADAVHLPCVIIYKCIIPKETLYYVGTKGDICAKKMLVVEEVK
jgi:hypothetical protein